MKPYYLIVVLILLSSCIKESSTVSYTIFINSTSHNISVHGFKNGIIQSESSFSLNANETKNVFTLDNRGIGNGLTFGGFNQPIDSFIVTFDNIFEIAHYKPTLVGTRPKKYLYTSRRNIYNDSSYVANLIKDEKLMRNWDFKYTIIEQDFLDAH